MFTPVEMSELDIFVPESDVDAITQTLARLGVIHLQDPNALGRWGEGVGTEWLGRVTAYTTQERRIEELLNRLGCERVSQPWRGRLSPGGDLMAIEEEVQEIESEVHALTQKEADLKREIRRCELVRESLSGLAPLSVSISDLRQLELLHLIVGTIPAENLARLEASLFRIPYAIIPVHRYGERVLVFGFCAHEDAPILERALESAFLEPLVLPEESGGTPQEALTEAAQRLEKAQTELIAVQGAQQELAQRLGPRLQSMLTRVRNDRALAEARAHFGHRKGTYLISGWVANDRVENLRSDVEKVSEGRATIEERPALGPGEHTKVPTLLKNPRLLKPLEGLVTTYGTPGYREIDPTPILGITFVLMFGWMFGDLGHGLVLAALGALLVLRVIPQLAGMAEAGLILVGCGLSSALFGLLYGSLFGMEDVIPPLWLSPMHDILTLLEAAVAFGVVALSIGFVCRMASAVHSGNVLEAIFDKNGIVGGLLYWSLLAILVLPMLIGSMPGWLPGILGLLTLALLFAEPLTNLVTGRRPIIHGGMGMYLVQGFFELFETFIGYASNTLSFVRLGAFAVAHAGLSMVVFILADMLSSGAMGGVLRIAVIVAGNIVVIGFEGLVVGIQTLRLEYYELFGKFFKGEGVSFKPVTMPTV